MKKKATSPTGTIKLEVPGLQNWHGHGAPVDVVGAGAQDFEFPTEDTMVKVGIEKAEASGLCTVVGKIVGKARQRRAARKGRNKTKTPTIDVIGGQGILPSRPRIIRVIPTLPDEPKDKLGQTLVRGASGLQQLMVGRQLDGIVYKIMGRQAATMNWAVNNMPAKYQPGATSLKHQFDVLEPRFKKGLMGLFVELKKRNPNAPDGVLMNHAVQLLMEQLAPFMFIADVYADSFGQYRDGVFAEQLHAINLFYEQAAALFKHADPDSPDKASAGLESIVYQVGDVYLARVTSMSLATIPGSKGPIGIHALQLPFEMLDVLAIMFPLLAHEFRHNIFADVKGLEEEMKAVVKAAIVDSHTAGTLKFQSETIALGSQAAPARDLMVKLMIDSIGEIDADISGGVLMDGSAYLYNMMLSFPAMLVRDTTVEKAKKLLRTESVYKLVPQQDGSHALVFEPHPPDYIRAYIVAAALEEIGFKAEADECRRLADFAVGTPLPTHITWKDGGGEEEHEEGEAEGGESGEAKPQRSDMVIAIPVEDIKAVAPVVAKAIIRSKLKSLDNRSTFDMLNWNAHREAKVQKLADILVAGGSDLPTEGSIYATYIGAAATLAYWRLLHNGGDDVNPAEVAKAVNANAMKMIAALRARTTKTA